MALHQLKSGSRSKLYNNSIFDDALQQAKKEDELDLHVARSTGTGMHVRPNISQVLIIHDPCSKLRLRSTSRILFHAK